MGKMEGIPVSIMEALACELPVVATQLSGVPELVRPNETGYLVPPAHASALASALAQVYQNYERAKQLAANGRRLVLQEFELTNNVNRLSHLFQQHINTTILSASNNFAAAIGYE
jgi:glycosyltransferase involved in cell wall biosynthesis